MKFLTKIKNYLLAGAAAIAFLVSPYGRPAVSYAQSQGWVIINGVMQFAGNVTIKTGTLTVSAANPSTIYSPSVTGDSIFTTGVSADGAADDNDGWVIYKSGVNGTNPIAGFGRGFSGFTNLTLAGNNFFIFSGNGAGGLATKTNWRGIRIHDADGVGSPMISGDGAGTGAGSPLYLQCNAGSVTCLQLMVGGTGYWQLSGTTGNWEPVTTNQNDLGSATKLVRTGYFGTSVISPTFVAGPGTTAIAPITLTNGTNLTTATANAMENDGVSNYFTHDTTNGRKAEDNWNYFRLTGSGSGITTIADFFGTNDGIPLVANGVYEIEWHCYFSQATAGTATWTVVTATTALATLTAEYNGSNIAGIGTVGAPQTAAVQVTASSSTALPVTGTEATAVTHEFVIHAILTAGNGASNTRLRLTMSAGTATPLINSYFKVRRLPAANTGTFVS